MIGWSVAVVLAATLALACHRIETLQADIRALTDLEKVDE